MSAGPVVPYSSALHLPTERGVTWDTLPGYDGVSAVTQVVLLEQGQQVEPEAMTEHQDTEPAPVAGESGLKYRYQKSLRGRIGSGPEQLTHAEFVLLAMLLTYSDERLSHAHPGNARLAADCGMTGAGASREVGKRVGALVRKGYAVVTRRGTNAGGNVSQEYRLKLPEWP